MRKLIALTLAGWILVMAPSAALALCLGSQAGSCCCAEAKACCCRDAGQSDPVPAPATPVAKASPEQLAVAATGAGTGFQLRSLAPALIPSGIAPAQASAPIFITSCAFRC